MRTPTVAPVAPASALAAGRRRPIGGDVSVLPLRALELDADLVALVRRPRRVEAHDDRVAAGVRPHRGREPTRLTASSMPCRCAAAFSTSRYLRWPARDSAAKTAQRCTALKSPYGNL